MINKLNLNVARNVLIVLPSLLILFHLCVIVGLIPNNVVWTGRVTTENQVLLMGVISIILNLIIIVCVVVPMKFRNTYSYSIIEKITPFVFWWLIGNTIANLFSKTMFEIYVFTPILIILSLCFYRLKVHKVSS